MATTSPAFLRVWRHDGLRAVLLSHMDTETICALRLTATECCELTTPTLFTRTRLTFTPSALSRPSRLEALSRIGHHIEHLTFSMPHSSSTFLPPLINPDSGREVNFLYTPHTSTASVGHRPKYGCSELGDLLTQQYPPLFHAATNVPAFINAFSQLPNLRHLTIACPGQDPAQRYRRDCVDYALISLRIAIERAPLLNLSKLSLSHIHPSALVYLRHMPGFGCTPSSGRRWKQIRKLNITMDSWDFSSPSQPGLDHLKILDDYIRSFSSTLEKVSFVWNGRRKGPCPFTLFSDPLFAPPRKEKKLFAEVTSPMSPLPAAPLRPSMVFPKLKYMQVRNATMSAEQVSGFILDHRHTVREFDFENVVLVNGGTWEDALSPLTSSSESEEWLSQQSGSEVESALSFNNLSDMEQVDERENLSEVIDTALDPNASFEGLPPKELSDPIEPKTKRVRRKRRRKTSHKRPPLPESQSSFKTTASGSKILISAPIPISGPIEEVLMPTIFTQTPPNLLNQPSSSLKPGSQGIQRNLFQEVLLPTTFSPNPTPIYDQTHTTPSSTFITDPNIQGVQRNFSQEERIKELADDPEKRVSTLRKAKEAVLRQLGKEFCKEKKGMGMGSGGMFRHGCGSRSRALLGGEGSTSALVPLMFSRY